MLKEAAAPMALDGTVMEPNGLGDMYGAPSKLNDEAVAPNGLDDKVAAAVAPNEPNDEVAAPKRLPTGAAPDAMLPAPTGRNPSSSTAASPPLEADLLWPADGLMDNAELPLAAAVPATITRRPLSISCLMAEAWDSHNAMVS